MAKSVGARINKELHEWLEEKAQEKKTTKARIIEDLLLNEYKSDMEEEAAESREDGGSVALAQVPQLRDIEGAPIIEAGEREIATEIRGAHAEWLAEEDDGRLTDVRFQADVPERVLRDAHDRIVQALKA